MKESEKERLKCAVYESTLSTADAVPLPRWGRLRGAALCADFCKRRCPKVVSSHQPLETTDPCFQATGFKRFKGFRWRLRRDPSTQVATVLAFVISHTTFLTAQDDETGQCPKAGG